MKYQDPSPVEWLRRRKRLVLYVLSFVFVVVLQTLLYWWGMANVEGDPRSLLEALNVVVQSLTTTGYGQDAPWESTVLSILVIIIQFTGVAYIFVAFPLFIVPWIRDAIIEPTVPDAIEGVDDHVILCGYSSLCSTLVEDLETRNHPYVIVEGNEDLARDLYESGKSVVFADTVSDETLRNVRVQDARAIVVDARQENVITTLLAIREFDSEMEILCLIEDPERSQYLRYAGAATVLSPKHRLGKSLADKAQNAVSTDLENVEEFDADIEIAEFPVTEESGIYGRSLSQLDDLEKTGANLLGAWVRGEFVASFSKADYVDETTVLVLAGTEAQLDQVERITRAGKRSPTTGPVIIAGHGIVGMTAEGILRKAGRQTTVVDTERNGDVDVVGDATNGETLHDAGIDRAETVIVALPDDEAAILTTLVAREITPDIDIIVAANDADHTSKFYSAGADYVLTLPKVAGRMTTLHLFDEDVMTLREQIQLTQTDAPTLGGNAPNNEEIRRTTDAVIVAVRRDGELIADFDDDFEIADDDEVIVAGTDEGVDEFEAEFSG